MRRLPDETRLRAWRGLLAVHGTVTQALEEALQGSHRLSLPWYQVLVELRLAGGSLRMHRLAELATLSRSGTTRLVDRIEAEGLVERRMCPNDHRGVEVVLTAKGREVQERAAPLALRTIQQHFGQYLDDADAGALLTILEAVVSAAGKDAGITNGEVAPPRR